MKVCPHLFLSTFAAALLLPSAANAVVTIGYVTVGDPGNAADDTTGHGAVAYTYQIAKYEVTIGQYTEFLNAKAQTDTYSLYNTNMATDLNIAGISRSGSPGSYTYSVIGTSNRPVTYVSWFDAARFSNWMHNGQGNGDTEFGAYALNGATSGVSFTASAGALYRLPKEDEWYKAAYYDPTPGASGNNYWRYPTRSDIDPGNQSGADANQANYYERHIIGIPPFPIYDYSVTQSHLYSSTQNYLTGVGSFSGSRSYYSTSDQGGNVGEWNDAVVDSSRVYRGGSWGDHFFLLDSLSRTVSSPSYESSYLGFRLATAPVPEPSSLLIVAISGVALATRRRRAAWPFSAKPQALVT